MEYRVWDKRNTKAHNTIQRVSSPHSTFHIPHSAGGFTLIEMIVALFIFSVVMVVATAALVSVIEANRKAQSVESVMTNVSFAIDSMSRALRVGTEYNPGPGSSCIDGGVSSLEFMDVDGQSVAYRLNGGQIERRIGDPTESFIAMTAPEVTIERFCLYVQGESPSDGEQPRILILVGGRAGQGKTETLFDIQTLVSQRIIDR